MAYSRPTLKHKLSAQTLYQQYRASMKDRSDHKCAETLPDFELKRDLRRWSRTLIPPYRYSQRSQSRDPEHRRQLEDARQEQRRSREEVEPLRWGRLCLWDASLTPGPDPS